VSRFFWERRLTAEKKRRRKEWLQLQRRRIGLPFRSRSNSTRFCVVPAIDHRPRLVSPSDQDDQRDELAGFIIEAKV
jgi:hypothetical protein